MFQVTLETPGKVIKKQMTRQHSLVVRMVHILSAIVPQLGILAAIFLYHPPFFFIHREMTVHPLDVFSSLLGLTVIRLGISTCSFACTRKSSRSEQLIIVCMPRFFYWVFHSWLACADTR